MDAFSAFGSTAGPADQEGQSRSPWRDGLLPILLPEQPDSGGTQKDSRGKLIPERPDETGSFGRTDADGEPRAISNTGALTGLWVLLRTLSRPRRGFARESHPLRFLPDVTD